MINYRRTKRFFEKTIDYVVYTLSFFGVIVGYFVFYLFKRHTFKLRKPKEKTMIVLANGPSLKESLSMLLSDGVPHDTNFIVMNYFAFSSEFLRLKPTHYCFADSMFFVKNHRYEEVKKLFQILNEKVDWDMNIYMNPSKISQFLEFSGITNHKIHIVACGGYPYNGFKCLNRWSYRQGLSTPPISTVAHLAIWVAINSGCRDVKLYGADHSFYNSLRVNDDNVVCNVESHFYEKEQLKPMLKTTDSKPYTMYEYISHTASIFLSHELLADYANSIGTAITNCTPNSLIDCYPRFIQRI